MPGRSAPQDLTCQYTMARYEAATVYRPPSSAASTTRSAASRPASATGARQQASSNSQSENKRRTAALWSLFDSFVSNRDESIESGVIRQLSKAHESLGAEAGWDSRRNSSLMCKLRATEQVEVDGSTFVTQFNQSLERLAGHEFDLLIEEFTEVAEDRNMFMSPMKPSPVKTLNTNMVSPVSVMDCAPMTPGSEARRVRLEREQDVLQAKRKAQLLGVFGMFDLDDSGVIEPRELLKLGKTRRSLGQKQGKWTLEKNDAMIRKMDLDDDGVVSRDEFSEYFKDALSFLDPEEFDNTIADFMDVANACRDGTYASDFRSPTLRRSPRRGSPRQSLSPRRPSLMVKHTQSYEDEIVDELVELLDEALS